MMNVGPDCSASYLGNLGSILLGGPRGPPPGPRRSQHGQRKELRKIVRSMSLNDDVQLNRAERAWRPSVKKVSHSEEDDPEQAKTRGLFKRLRGILNKLTPQKFQELMKQVTELMIDTEERLKGAIDLIFERAISEPNFSVAYGKMCHCLIGLKVPTTDKPGITVNFRRLLLNRCQKEFEKDQDDDEMLEKKQKELEAAEDGEERDRLKVGLDEARVKARRRSLGNIKFIGELFKLKMLTEAIMHDCVKKLLKNHDEESLECLCRLLSTIGKGLDHVKVKPCMDQYFKQMDKIIKERKTSSRIRFMLQDVLDLRGCYWVPRREEQGPKTIDQIHKEAELEEHREHLQVQKQLFSRKDGGGGGGGRMAGNTGGRGAHNRGGGWTNQPQDEGWNTLPIPKDRLFDTARLIRISKLFALNLSALVLAPAMLGSWGKGCNGGAGDRPSSGEPVKRENTPTPPPSKPALTKEEVEEKAYGIIEKYLKINYLKEALQCVAELNSASLLCVFVRKAVESTLKCNSIARQHVGLLLRQLIKAGTLPTQQYCKGLQEVLEVAEDMATEEPHIWLYLAELITPMLREGGIPMGQLFREISKPLLPLRKAGVLLAQILTLLSKATTPKKVGAMWMKAGLSWSDFLPEDEDVNQFVTDQRLEFTVFSAEELLKQLDRLLQDNADTQCVLDWAEANLNEEQTAANQFVHALVTSVCQSAIVCEDPYRVDVEQLSQRAALLQRYLCDEHKELQALYALQALMVHMEQPANLLLMLFDLLMDEDVIKKETFYKWESSQDPAEQTGKDVAVRSVTAFFTLLHEADKD